VNARAVAALNRLRPTLVIVPSGAPIRRRLRGARAERDALRGACRAAAFACGSSPPGKPAELRAPAEPPAGALPDGSLSSAQLDHARRCIFQVATACCGPRRRHRTCTAVAPTLARGAGALLPAQQLCRAARGGGGAGAARRALGAPAPRASLPGCVPAHARGERAAAAQVVASTAGRACTDAAERFAHLLTATPREPECGLARAEPSGRAEGVPLLQRLLGKRGACEAAAGARVLSSWQVRRQPPRAPAPAQRARRQRAGARAGDRGGGGSADQAAPRGSDRAAALSCLPAVHQIM